MAILSWKYNMNAIARVSPHAVRLQIRLYTVPISFQAHFPLHNESLKKLYVSILLHAVASLYILLLFCF